MFWKSQARCTLSHHFFPCSSWLIRPLLSLPSWPGLSPVAWVLSVSSSPSTRWASHLLPASRGSVFALTHLPACLASWLQTNSETKAKSSWGKKKMTSKGLQWKPQNQKYKRRIKLLIRLNHFRKRRENFPMKKMTPAYKLIFCIGRNESH